MKTGLALIAFALFGVAVAAQDATSDATKLFNPYERVKNGPPLTNIFQKAKPEWIWSKLREPQHDLAARMPEFDFTPEEVLDIMAYLKSLQQPPTHVRDWPAWADKEFDDLEDDEFEELFDLSDQGQRVWSNARCSICHSINGPGGEIIGGVVDLRVGGMNLQIAGPKLNRDWLFSWIQEPKNYFPDTLMPRFRLSDDAIRALVEYILRDDAFIPPETEDPERPKTWKQLDLPERAIRGKALMELSRCVVCHDVKGISELVTKPLRPPPADKDSFEFLAYDVRCLTCHTIEGRGGTYAPDLSSEGSRLFKDWIQRFVENPDMIRPLSQQMPKFNLTKSEAQTVAEYMEGHRLDGEIPEAIPGRPTGPVDVNEGRGSYLARGCFACHSIESEGPGGSVGPALDKVRDRLKPGFLWSHLKDPHRINPYSAEPDYDLTDAEARSLAAYLTQRKNQE